MTSPRTVKITEIPASTQDLNDTDSLVAVQPYGSSLLTVKLPASKILDAARTAGAESASANGMNFTTLAEAQASALLTTRLVGATLNTAGYSMPGDAGGATYQKVSSEPSVPGKFQDVAGGWWKLVSTFLTPEMFSAVADGTTNDTTSVQYAINQGQLENKPVILSKKEYGITNVTFALPVAGSVYAPCLIGVPSGDDGSFPVLKRIAGGDTSYTLATYGWVNDVPSYFGGGYFQDFTIDNDDIGYHGFVTHMSAGTVRRVNVINCLGDGFLVPLTTQAGTNLVGSLSQMKFYELRAKNCVGAGFRIAEATTVYCADGEIIDCNFSECEEYCLDVQSCAGFTISGNRMFNYLRGAPFAGTALSRITSGKTTRISNNVFGGDGVSPDVYNLELNVRFYPTLLEFNSFDGAGAGLLVNFVNTGNNGLCRVENNYFIRKGPAAGEPKIVHGTNDADAIIISSGNVFQIDTAEYPYDWVSGNTSGVIVANYDNKQDSAGTGGKVFFHGNQQPDAIQTYVFGTKVIFDGDGTSYQITDSTPRSILRNAEMTANQDVVLPEFAADGQTYEITRGRDATGAFNLNVKRHDGTTIVALNKLRTSVTVTYSKTFTDWYSNSQSSWSIVSGVQMLFGTSNYTSYVGTPRILARGAVMTADQKVLLPATPADGDVYHLIRMAGCTGAYNLSLARSDTTVLHNLTVEKSSVKAVYSSTYGNWIVTDVLAW